MKVALVVNKIKSSIQENIKDILEYIEKAKEHNADLVVFSETAITGLCLTDNPLNDIELGLSTESIEIIRLCNSAKNNNINVTIGILERDVDELYDTALFINRKGEIALKYRRISVGWRDSSQDSIYKEGTEIGVLNSDFGKICFLICGDLFDEELVSKVKKAEVDYLLFPFARSFQFGFNIKEKWEKEAFKEYLEQIKKINTLTLATNYIDECYFGGAFAINRDGSIISYLEIGQEGMLVVTI